MFYLHKKSSKKIKEEVKTSDTIIVPFGSLESHGAHNAVGSCYLLAEKASKDVGEKTGISVTPVIPFGVSYSFKKLHGTLTVSSEALSKYTQEVCESLIRSGFKKIAFFSAHGGNLSVLRELSNHLRDKYGVLCAVVHLWSQLKKATPNYNTVFWDPDLVLGHGGEPVTSVMMHLFPEVVDLNEAVWEPLSQPFTKFKTTSEDSHKYKDLSWNIMLSVDEVGYTGDPRRGSAEKGKILYNNLITKLVEFIEAFSELETKA
ncbi:creatininase family protein [Thermoproteota archaeon]